MSGKRTSHDHIVQVVTLHKAGLKNREIANQTKVNEKTVSRLLKKWRDEGGSDNVPDHKKACGPK